MRRWYRGRNTCSRSDVEFMPLPGSALAAKREQSHRSRQTSSVKNNTGSSSSSAPKDARRSDVRRDDEQQRVSFNLVFGFSGFESRWGGIDNFYVSEFSLWKNMGIGMEVFDRVYGVHEAVAQWLVH